MQKELERIQKLSSEIIGDYPAKREKLVKELLEARTKLSDCQARKEAAESLTDFDKASAAVERAEMVVKFARIALDKLDGEARITEAEYEKAVAVCKNVMDRAVSSYREKAADLMDQLKALQDEYQQTAEDANNTLEKLDVASNVLQSKYPYKIQKYQNAPETKKKDPTAWREHAVRYNGHALATDCSAEEKSANPSATHDSVLCAAWHAVIQAYPRKAF